jgi:hypothetical protein
MLLVPRSRNARVNERYARYESRLRAHIAHFTFEAMKLMCWLCARRSFGACICTWPYQINSLK